VARGVAQGRRQCHGWSEAWQQAHQREQGAQCGRAAWDQGGDSGRG